MMRIHVLLLLLLLCLPSLAFAADLKQICGTHLFVDLPEYVQFSAVSGGYGAYIKDKIAINLDASRTGVSLEEVKKQFSVPPAGMQRIKVGNPDFIVLRGEQQVGQARVTSFLFIAGDAQDSAMLTATLLKPYDTEDNVKMVLNLLGTAEWRATSDLDFEKLEFFLFPGQNKSYVPVSRAQNGFIFIPKGDRYPRPNVSLSITRTFSQNDLKGQEASLADFLLRTDEVSEVIDKDISALQHLSERNIQLIASYKTKDGAFKTKYLLLIFKSNFVYQITMTRVGRKDSAGISEFSNIVNNIEWK